MKYLCLLAVLILPHCFFSQNNNTKSTLLEQSEYYKSLGVKTDAEWDVINNTHTSISKTAADAPQAICTLNKRVFGWHPYWNGSTYLNYQWNLLSDMCYFSYDASATTGNNTNASFAWNTSAAVTTAINNGSKVHFTVTLFSSHTTFLGSATAKQTLITNIINLLNARGGDGVNIDFEGMGSTHKAAFTAFMQDLCNQVHAANPAYEVSVCLYAVDWSAVFDIPNLNNYVDLYTIMGYDYYYSGSTTAGPEDPLYNFQTTYNYTLTKSITYYLAQGATPSKLLLGLPWYGREWETAGSTAPSSTTGGFTSSRTYAYVRNNAATYSVANQHWEPNSFSNYFSYQSAGLWRQCWIDNAYGMRKRFDMVNQRGIGGIGIWALGYDDGYTDYWDAIKDKFSSCAVVPCSDTLYDMGGPLRNYYDKEKYTYTIQPTGSSNVSATFTQFNLEANYDSLWLYNGTSTTSPLIGAYTGTNSPGTVTTTNGALTLRFKSDNLTTTAGFAATYTCIVNAPPPPDNTAPTTQSTSPGTWKTTNFTETFTDADNAGGSGVQKGYYSVNDFNGIEWRANDQNGFFMDEFTTAIHPDWTQKTGSWAVTGQALTQSDEVLSNTNIYAKLKQNLSNRYLYHFNAKISGTGTNRRAGLHFACTRPDSTNRYDGYFAWFRVDNNVTEIYKVTNNVFSLVASFPTTILAGTYYDYKVVFDRITGKIWVYQNNALIGTYTDATPYQNGTYISFRSGNANFAVNDIVVYRSRASTASVAVGSATTNDIRYKNPNPQTSSAKIKSICQDSANNISAIFLRDLNIDWTIPKSVDTVRDGVAADIAVNTSRTQLSANWNNSFDTSSAVASYWYSIGTTAGATNTLGWTNNSTSTTVTKTGLNLTQGQMYYVNVKALNGAGLYSNVISSNGQLVDTVIVVQPIDNTAPTSQSTSAGVWKTTAFTESFTDIDNAGGSGVQKGYYTVNDFNGTEWRANDQNGFFADEFTTAIHPDWTMKTGTWAVTGQALTQTDETLANTNIYAKLRQNLSDRYLYHFNAKISGTAMPLNRRAGLHFACTRPDSTNRFDGYFAWFRVDNGATEIYKVSNNVFALVASFPTTIVAGTYYDYKIIYDRITGKITVYQNNTLIGTCTDTTPYQNGTYISFRSGNATLAVNDIRVYRSRANTASVSVGAAAINDVRYRNPNPQTPSVKIKSICQDSSNNLSAIFNHDLNIDWTSSSTAGTVRDGLASDVSVNTSHTSLSANWDVAADTNSAIDSYWYSIGTTAGATNVLTWTNNSTATFVTKTGLILTQGQMYYVNVKALNGAGLYSSVISSNGQLIDTVVVIPTPPDITAPTTQVTSSAIWKTGNFTATFADADNAGGSGVQKGFYQVSDFNGIEWRANDQNGFFKDEFTNSIHPDWTIKTGTWSISNQVLLQTNQILANTNIYAKVKQNLSNRYLYHFTAQISGAGTNRNAAFHFACTRPDSSNRYDGYYVLLKSDNNLLELHKVTNNVASAALASFPVVITAGVYYDYKIIFDRITGKIWMYQNNTFIGAYTDAIPYQNGTYVSFKSENAMLAVNDLNVYRSRANTASITVGTASTNDIRFENTSPFSAAATITSVSQDSANNLSLLFLYEVNVDWTKPIKPSQVSDSSMVDADTAYNASSFSGFYSMATDTNSGIINYWYAIGSSAGAQDIVAWSDNSLALSALQTGLNLVPGTRYYFMVKAFNGAGIVGDSAVSDGILVLNPIGLKSESDDQQSALLLYPNPVKNNLTISIVNDREEVITISICDITGKSLLQQQKQLNNGLNYCELNIANMNFAAGIYLLKIKSKANTIVRKFVIE